MRTNNKLVKESLPLGSALLDARSVNTDWGGVIEFDRSGNNPISLNGFEDQDFSSSPRNRWINAEDRYFAIICSQFAMNPYNLTDPPSRHHHHRSNGYLALQVEVQWPYKVFDPSSSESFREVHERYRSKISFPVAITR